MTESLELARLLVLGESNVRDLSAILERLAYGILVDVERQVTNEYCHAPILLLGGFAGGENRLIRGVLDVEPSSPEVGAILLKRCRRARGFLEVDDGYWED